MRAGIMPADDRVRALVADAKWDTAPPLRLEGDLTEIRAALNCDAAFAQKPRSLSPGWSSGRRPSGQWYSRCESLMGRSLIDACLTTISPCSSNSQFSLP